MKIPVTVQEVGSPGLPYGSFIVIETSGPGDADEALDALSHRLSTALMHCVSEATLPRS